MTPPPHTPLLDVRNLCVCLTSGTKTTLIVDHVSFKLNTHETLGLVGESGSGKSMTALALMGLIDAPNLRVSGSIFFKGQDLFTLSEKDLRRLRGKEIAMIFQDPMTAFTPVYTIGWQIDEQIRTHENLTRKQARSRSLDLLADMGVPDPIRTAERYPHQLSGGLKQRAMIAMALSCRPSLLIADEPTTALDVTVQAQILELMVKLRDTYGSSIVFITHDMGVVAETCDTTLVLYSGRVAEYSTTETLFSAPQHPYSQALLNSIPPMHGPRPPRLPAIGGMPPTPFTRPDGCAFAPRCPRAQHVCTFTLPPLIPIAPQHNLACLRPWISSSV